jgi:hypothetical protein
MGLLGGVGRSRADWNGTVYDSTPACTKDAKPAYRSQCAASYHSPFTPGCVSSLMRGSGLDMGSCVWWYTCDGVESVWGYIETRQVGGAGRGWPCGILAGTDSLAHVVAGSSKKKRMGRDVVVSSGM